MKHGIRPDPDLPALVAKIYRAADSGEIWVGPMVTKERLEDKWLARCPPFDLQLSALACIPKLRRQPQQAA